MTNKIKTAAVASLVAPAAIAAVLSGAGSANAATGDECGGVRVSSTASVDCSLVATPGTESPAFNKGLGAQGKGGRFFELQNGVFGPGGTNWVKERQQECGSMIITIGC